VPEGQLLVSLDEQVCFEELSDRSQEIRRGSSQRACQLVERERATERGGDGGGVARLVGEAAEPLAHLVLHTTGQLAVDQLGAAADDAYPVLFLQSEQGFDDEEGITVGFRQLLADRLIRLRGEDVGRQLSDCIVIEWAENDSAGSLLLQPFECVCHRCRLARRAMRDDPCDRESREAHRQGANRRRRPGIYPVGIVDRDQEWRLECRALEQLLQVSQQPEPLLGVGMKSGELAWAEQRLGSVEQRCKQRRELDHRLARLGRAASDSDAEAAGHSRNLCEQATLSHAAGALDDDHRFGAVGEALELALNER